MELFTSTSIYQPLTANPPPPPEKNKTKQTNENKNNDKNWFSDLHTAVLVQDQHELYNHKWFIN